MPMLAVDDETKKTEIQREPGGAIRFGMLAR
jgi:hypothetical protein